jgi:hypothetical protein
MPCWWYIISDDGDDDNDWTPGKMDYGLEVLKVWRLK